MNKIFPIFLLGLLFLSAGFSFDLFAKPITPVDMTTLHSINQSNYGFNDTNSTCEPVHFSLPYQYASKSYIRIGYIPLCDVNQSSYQESITFFCNGEYLFTDNVTDSCVNGNPYFDDYNSEWVEINATNVQQGAFQSEGLSNVFSCMACVNSTSDIPQADFWLRVENTGNNAVIEYHNETVIVGSTLIEDTIGQLVQILYLTFSFIRATAPIIFIIWSLFAVILFFLFMLRRTVKSIKASVPKR